MTATVSIPARFNGPPDSGHGGYSCGMFALRAGAVVGDAPRGSGFVGAEVTLRLPPPLETPLELVPDGERVLVRHGEALVADVRPVSEAGPQRPDWPVPAAPTLDEAQDAEQRSAFRTGTVRHPFPTCFGCGPSRTPEDGLRLWPGLLADGRAAACLWKPAEWAGRDGLVRPEMVWAALDCPGALGALEQLGSTLGEQTWLLGRLSVNQRAQVPVGDAVVVLGWLHGQSGRKRQVGSALLDAHGDVLASAAATWVTVP